jgi:spermidine/putrescine transport system substrate-binding protein
MPQAVLDAFTKEYGVKVTYVAYDSAEEAVANIQANKVYDVVVLENEFIPDLIAAGLLNEINYANIPNFDHISPSFKNLAYDPQNKHTIPYNWGSTALVVDRSLATAPVTRWADLWQATYAGKIAIRPNPREVIGLALKTLGHSINSEEPAELEAVLKRLLEIRPTVRMVDNTSEDAVPVFKNKEAVILAGWSGDVLAAREENLTLDYVFPEEGAILWGDNFVIPANSPHPYTAELFINFLLRPEISAQITNEVYYPSANEAARPLVDAELLNDPVVIPPLEAMKKAEVLLPLSPEGRELYAQIWDRFMAAGQE